MKGNFQLYLNDTGEFKVRGGHDTTVQVNKIFWLICGYIYYFDSLRGVRLKIKRITKRTI